MVMAEGSEHCGESIECSLEERVLKRERGSQVLGLKAPGEDTWTFSAMIMSPASRGIVLKVYNRLPDYKDILKAT